MGRKAVPSTTKNAAVSQPRILSKTSKHSSATSKE